MADTSLPTRVELPPPSAVSGELYRYLRTIAGALNEIPRFSYYSGNPNSNLTANVGAVVVNIASAATARLWVKLSGTSSTGWASVATV